MTFSTGIAAGGNLAYWVTFLISCVFTFITAAVIAEVCSSLPLAGSIYLWAAESGGPKYGRLFGFVVAWWSTTAWTTFCASNTQAAVNYMLSVSLTWEEKFARLILQCVLHLRKLWYSTLTFLRMQAASNFAPSSGHAQKSCWPSRAS